MKILNTLLFCLSLYSVSGQSYLGGRFGYGSTNVVSDFSKYDSQFNYSAGMNFNTNLNRWFLIGGEMLFDNRGYSYSYNLTNSNGDIVEEIRMPFNYHYLGLRILASFQSPGKFYPFARFGVFPSLLLKATFTEPVFH